MQNSNFSSTRGPRRNILIVVIIVVIAVASFIFLDYQNLFYTNLISIPNMINLSTAAFVNSPSFNITYNLSYMQTNTSTGSEFNSVQLMTVSKYGDYLKFYMLGHTIIPYYNSTLGRNVSESVPVSKFIIYNSTGTINCDNNPILFNLTTLSTLPNPNGYENYNSTFSVYNSTKSADQIMAQKYYNLFIYQVFMLPMSDPTLSASSVLQIGTNKYNGDLCSLDKITYSDNTYEACFSKTYGIPLYMDLHVVRPGTSVHLNISSVFNNAPVNASQVTSLPSSALFS